MSQKVIGSCVGVVFIKVVFIGVNHKSFTGHVADLLYYISRDMHLYPSIVENQASDFDRLAQWCISVRVRVIERGVWSQTGN